jgi:hypothetical protein
MGFLLLHTLKSPLIIAGGCPIEQRLENDVAPARNGGFGFPDWESRLLYLMQARRAAFALVEWRCPHKWDYGERRSVVCRLTPSVLMSYPGVFSSPILLQFLHSILRELRADIKTFCLVPWVTQRSNPNSMDIDHTSEPSLRAEKSTA